MLDLILCALNAADFEASVRAASVAYERVKGATEKALTAGDLAAAEKLFLDAVPEKDRTAAHWFLLGNYWFDLDPAFAMSMHEKAFALAPDEPLVQREWALELHRAGKHAQAEPLYAKLVAGGAEDAQLALALRADCLLEMGKHIEAAAAWAEARDVKPKAHAVHAFAWLYGPENKIARRARILGELAAGKTDHAEELMLGDVFWSPEDDRYFVKYEYMMNDLPIVLEKLGRESARAKDLEPVVQYLFLDWEQQFPRGEDAVPRNDLKKAAKERGWLDELPKLPVDDRVAAAVVDALRDQGFGTPQELLDDFGADLARRAASPDAPPEVAQALIKLARKAKSPKLDEYKLLEKPEARVGARKAVEDARAAKQPTRDLLVNQIRAEVRAQKPDGNALDKAFAALATESPK